MNFLSADGFPITLDGVVEFRVLPEKVAEMFVKYNEDANGDAIDEEIIAKIITPESRSLCRIGGSKLSGGQFISGEDREKFQTDLVKSLTENCKKQGSRSSRWRSRRSSPPTTSPSRCSNERSPSRNSPSSSARSCSSSPRRS